METLSNGILSIAVKEFGAELSSLRHNGREYLWQADPAFWKRHSPVLFPFVGSVWNGEYRAKGITYKMGQHGFARDMVFTLIYRSPDEMRFRLVSSPDTLAKYPYQFCLEIGYKLIDNRVRISWHVINTGDEVLPFQIGAHPAFYWPLLSDSEISDGVKAQEATLASTDRRGFFKIESKSQIIPLSVVTEKGCIGAESSVTLDADGYLPLDVHTFDHDALVIEDSLVSKVTLCDNDKRPYLAMEFSSPLVGLWSPPHKRAPFVCIEPWYGRADSVGFTGPLADKKWEQSLPPSQSFHASYDIIVCLPS